LPGAKGQLAVDNRNAKAVTGDKGFHMGGTIIWPFISMLDEGEVCRCEVIEEALHIPCGRGVVGLVNSESTRGVLKKEVQQALALKRGLVDPFLKEALYLTSEVEKARGFSLEF